MSDYLNAGNTADDLAALVSAAPEWTPPHEPDDDAVSSKSEKPPKESQADQLVKLAQQSGIELFHTPGGDPEAYVTVPVRGHRETMRVASKAFRMFLSRQLWTATSKVPGAQAVQDAINALAGRALYDGPEYPIAVRLAEHAGAIYLDLADDEWRAIRITAAGCHVVTESPVRFVRPRGVLRLPVPERGGRIDALREFINVIDDGEWLLMKGWLLGTLQPDRPFPLLALYGEQGSAKSTATRMLRELIDPNVAPLRSEPREPRDLMIAATNARVITLENLSVVPPWLSDALCRLSTGGGYSTRELYSDGEEKLFDAMRPVILNGITEVVQRPDLADRTIAITLPPISEERRLPESTLWTRFRKAQPGILACLLDAASGALRRVSAVSLPSCPRMADFTAWVTAAEPELGAKPGDFLRAYSANRATLNDTALDSCAIVPYLRILVSQNDGTWEGPASKLLENLNGLATDDPKRLRDWPKAANTLSGLIRRIAPNLRREGLDVNQEQQELNSRRKLIRIQRTNTVQTVQTVRNTEATAGSEGAAWFGDSSIDRSDGNGSFGPASEVPAENTGANDADDPNDQIPVCSGTAEFEEGQF